MFFLKKGFRLDTAAIVLSHEIPPQKKNPRRRRLRRLNDEAVKDVATVEVEATEAMEATEAQKPWVPKNLQFLIDETFFSIKTSL